jgi:hypothetical protein
MVGEYISMFDQDYDSAATEWIAACDSWHDGTHKDSEKHRADHPYYWDWDGGPPDRDSYRPAFTEEPTWFQMYETVSEGTPCTPPFETKAELIDWLVEKGESHDTQYEKRFTRSQAEAFVEQEWAPSFVVTAEHGLESGVEHADKIGEQS